MSYLYKEFKTSAQFSEGKLYFDTNMYNSVIVGDIMFETRRGGFTTALKIENCCLAGSVSRDLKVRNKRVLNAFICTLYLTTDIYTTAKA